MKRSYIAIASAAMLALSPVVATTSWAQATIDYDAIGSEVGSDLAQMGISGVDVETLTLKQLQEIKLVAGGKADMSDKKRQVDVILNKTE